MLFMLWAKTDLWEAMTEIIERSAHKDTEVDALALQRYQQIYHQLTNRSENLSFFKSDRHIIRLADLVDLHRVLEQTANTMNLEHSSLTIVQRTAGNTSERWTAFERFRVQAVDVNQVTSELELKYNFLIRLPNLSEPAPYSITIGLRNALKMLDDFKKNPSNVLPFDLLMMDRMATARWEIDFVDKSVARNFSQTIEDWYERLQKRPASLHEGVIKKAENFISPIFRVMAASILFFVIFASDLPTLVDIKLSDVALLLIFLYATHFFTSPLIEALRQRIGTVRTVASLLITRADERLMESDEKRRGIVWKGIWHNFVVPFVPTFVSAMLIYVREFFAN